MSDVSVAGDPLAGLSDRLASVRGRVADASARAGRSVDDLTLIVITKFHPVEVVRELRRLGVSDLGENRHQEASAKAAELADPDAHWHFVGQLQSNKARAALGYARTLHSVDRPSLVSALARIDPQDVTGSGTHRVDCFVQVNLTDDPGRGGVDESGLEALAEKIAGVPLLRLRGVMGVAPLDEEPRRAFARLRGASDRLRAIVPDAVSISAGMSHDFDDAVLEGATHLRIGSAITGNRVAAG